MMTPIQIEAAKASLQRMLGGGYFDICTIDNILKVSGGVPDKKSYDTLRLLHCIHFKDMSPQLRIELPKLIKLVVESQPMNCTAFDSTIDADQLCESVNELRKLT